VSSACILCGMCSAAIHASKISSRHWPRNLT